MIPVVLSMSFVVLVAVASLAFARLAQRDRSEPGGPWLGDLVHRVVEAVPVVADGDLDPDEAEEPSRR